jgi:hypothetical protein
LALVKTIGVSGPVSSASLHPSRSTLVWGGVDFMLHVVDYATAFEETAFKV